MDDYTISTCLVKTILMNTSWGKKCGEGKRVQYSCVPLNVLGLSYSNLVNQNCVEQKP
jgi:hypothetical protein